ncbi:MAG: hypothetical protein WBQ60_01715 [Asticcacaulis sp.]
MFFFAAQAQAADLTVKVNDTAGVPVPYAVVAWMPKNGADIPASLKKQSYVMAQKSVQFTPYVLAVPVGATVNFPNMDRVNHHVYSFSPAQPFQFPLYGKGKTHVQTFERAGTVALGCNIHDSMSAYIRVVATPWFATTDATGKVVLTGVPEGAGTLSVWHPAQDAPERQTVRNFSMGKGAMTQTFGIKVNRAAMPAGRS